MDLEDFQKWTRKWQRIEEKDRLAHTQKFFRMLLSDQASPRYYSFCNEDMAEEDCDWHCTICKGCRDWREWHCDGCNKCKIESFLSIDERMKLSFRCLWNNNAMSTM